MMKKWILPLLSLLLFLGSQGQAQGLLCRYSLIHTGPASKTREGVQIFRSRKSGRSMAFRFIQGSQRMTKLMIHGLGDDMTKWDAMVEQAQKDGFNLLLVDLHGHGGTLKDYMRHHDGLPESINFESNIEDITALVRALRVNDLVIEGHSYGGGIAYGVTHALETQMPHIRIHGLIQMAPYVQRVDKFLKEYFQSPQFLQTQATKAMEKTGMPKTMIDSFLWPFFHFAQSIVDNMKFYKDSMARILMIDKTNDLLMDPFVDQFMRKSYREYFVKMAGKAERDFSKEDGELIDLKVEAAIKVTKGIRGFDLLDTSKPLPKIKTRILVIGGKDDKLVIPDQLKNYAHRLEESGMNYQLTFVEGADAGHLFPQKRAPTVYDLIMDFLTQPSSVR